MNFGLGCVCTDDSMDPREVSELVEEMGLFDSLFFGEHTHIPASRTSPFPGGELPRDHCRAFDPFVALTAFGCPSMVSLAFAISAAVVLFVSVLWGVPLAGAVHVGNLKLPIRVCHPPELAA